MNIDAMPAGRELDALVAEKVMGWTACDANEAYPRWMHGDPGDEFAEAGRGRGCAPLTTAWRVPYSRYSTDIAAAWEVVEKVRGDRDVWLQWDSETSIWGCQFFSGGHECFADTAPLAICRAALKAVS